MLPARVKMGFAFFLVRNVIAMLKLLTKVKKFLRFSSSRLEANLIYKVKNPRTLSVLRLHELQLSPVYLEGLRKKSSTINP